MLRSCPMHMLWLVAAGMTFTSSANAKTIEEIEQGNCSFGRHIYDDESSDVDGDFQRHAARVLVSVTCTNEAEDFVIDVTCEFIDPVDNRAAFEGNVEVSIIAKALYDEDRTGSSPVVFTINADGRTVITKYATTNFWDRSGMAVDTNGLADGRMLSGNTEAIDFILAAMTGSQTLSVSFGGEAFQVVIGDAAQLVQSLDRDCAGISLD